MSDPLMPAEIRNWMQQRNWGPHHLEWHVVRQWDRLPPAARRWAEQQGWRRASPQEGEMGNGLEFLIMHRAMIELLRNAFAAHVGLFDGWANVPTDPADPHDPLPRNGREPFNPDMLTALRDLHANLPRFPDDDAFGQFIQTRWRPTPSAPFAQDPDRAAGIHNYIHGRFADPDSPVDMADPQVNLGNQRFWRLHGWIDARWTAFRAAKGLSAETPAIRASIEAHKRHLAGRHEHGQLMAAELVRPARQVVPHSVSSVFQESISREFHRLTSVSECPEDLGQLKEWLQLALKIEHFTIPLYLCAMWSLRSGAAKHRIIIRNIAFQEMLHMGLICNLLAALDDTPRIREEGMVPRYPDQLPGLDVPDVFELRPFSRQQVREFMTIEKPQHRPIVIRRSAAGLPSVKHKTIGDFYDAIDQALQKIPLPRFSLVRQHDVNIGGLGVGYTLFKIADAEQARKAIRLIKEQGEGTEVSVEAMEFGGELAHYYAFEQMDREVEYGEVDEEWKIVGELRLPPAEEVLPMSPIPDDGYPGVDEVEEFNAEYFAMLDDLHRAWEVPDADAFFQALYERMNRLSELAMNAMETERDPPFPPGYYGPTFRPPTARTSLTRRSASLVARDDVAANEVPAASTDYARVQQILTDAVDGASIGMHGNFWLKLTRDEFVDASVLGQKLVVARDDGAFDPDASAVVKALEGRAPFGRDLEPRPPGAIFNRMPSGGKPPVPQSQIEEIREWIRAGCPERRQLLAGRISRSTTRLITDQQHNDFWRHFDDVFLYNRTPEVDADLNRFMANATAYFAMVTAAGQETGWQATLANAETRAALLRVEAGQREIVLRHYGPMLDVPALLDSFERFGAGTLPDDPHRPLEPRHQMNGEVMWCFWSAFVDGCLRLAPHFASIPTPFWEAFARGVLLGLCNDGLVRGRFVVTGLPEASQGAIRSYVEQVANGPSLRDELARRCRESGLL